MSESNRPSQDWTGMCMKFTRMMFGVGAVGDFDGDGDADAVDGWKSAHRKHRTTDPHAIPRGVPVFWSGGRNGYGHAAPSVGGGQMWTTDLIRSGRVDLAPISLVRREWGLELLGWTEDINGVTVYTPPTKGDPMNDAEKRTIASLTRLEGILQAHMRASGHTKQLQAALEAAEKNNRDKGVID